MGMYEFNLVFKIKCRRNRQLHDITELGENVWGKNDYSLSVP